MVLRIFTSIRHSRKTSMSPFVIAFYGSELSVHLVRFKEGAEVVEGQIDSPEVIKTRKY